MKIKNFSAFSFIIVFMAIILYSCSNENLITSPQGTKENLSPIAKTVITPTVSINHSLDTVITLPKSKLSVVVKKNYPANRISILDNYLSTHKVSSSIQMQKISPDYRWCPYHYDTTWVLQNQYEPAPGKYLGIWTSRLDWTKCHDQYGFTYIATTFGGVSNALGANFDQNKIMINLGDNSTQNDIDSNPSYNYYFIDEPYQRDKMAQVCSYAYWISLHSPQGKLLFSDYYWPYSSLLCGTSGDYAPISGTLNLFSNLYIMCDQYSGNLCGNVHDFWNEYKADYGIPIKNISNFISLNYSSDWGTLLNLAKPWGMNPIWIYGDDSNINESYFQSFDNTAWQVSWLLRQQGRLVTVWKNVDGTCDWYNGEWQIVNSYYIGYRYTAY